MSKKEMDRGWTVSGGSIYHFKHVDREWADSQLEGHDNLLYAVEVIHHTLADEDHNVHQNTFLVWGYVEALLKAVQIQGAPYPDDVLGIRPATEKENMQWRALFNHYEDALFPPALSEQQVDELLSSEE